ncbi:hypothetical protein BC941DRAFT_474586 [Chlamydoabsidia padenii]|nr:hypothetical protein BC941DRAFT_474586 [Chlamydoabsidia padenii]
MNDTKVPPVFTVHLSDLSNTEEVNNEIIYTMEETDVDLLAIFNFAVLQQLADNSERQMEEHYRRLHQRIVHLGDGLRAVINSALDRINQLSQTPPASITKAVALIQMVSNDLGLELGLDDERWSATQVQQMIAQLPVSIRSLEHIIQQSHSLQMLDMETTELCDLKDILTMQLPPPINGQPTQRPYSTPTTISTVRNSAANLFRKQCTRWSGRPGMNIGAMSTIRRSYSYSIGLHIDNHNTNQLQEANLIQTIVPRSWAYQQIRLLDEFSSMGRQQRASLVHSIINIIPETRTLNRQRLEFLCDQSFRQLEQLIDETRWRLHCSTEYLHDPQQNAHLLRQCFRPALDHVVKKQPLFNLVPKPTFKKKYIKLTNTSMKTLLRSLGLPEYIHGDDTLFCLFALKKIRPRDGFILSKYILTDGFAASISFKKPIKTKDVMPRLVPEDFEDWEFKYLNVWGVYPGVTKCVFIYPGEHDTTGDDLDDYDGESHEIRKISSVEYYTKAGFKTTLNKINSVKTNDIRTSEPNIITNLPGIQQYIDSTLAFNEILWSDEYTKS